MRVAPGPRSGPVTTCVLRGKVSKVTMLGHSEALDRARVSASSMLVGCLSSVTDLGFLFLILKMSEEGWVTRKSYCLFC